MSFECPKCEARSWGARCPECGQQLIPDSFAGSTDLALDIRPVVRAAAVPEMAALKARRPRPGDVPPLALVYPWSARVWQLLVIAAVLFAVALTMPIFVRLGMGLIVGVCLYVFAAYWLNSTTIRVERGTLHVSYGPLPWLPGGRAAIADVDQIFVRTTYGSKRGNDLSWSWSRGWFRPRVVNISYGVVAALRDGTEITLLSDRVDIGESIALERQLETHLGIMDDGSRSVRDE